MPRPWSRPWLPRSSPRRTGRLRVGCFTAYQTREEALHTIRGANPHRGAASPAFRPPGTDRGPLRRLHGGCAGKQAGEGRSRESRPAAHRQSVPHRAGRDQRQARQRKPRRIFAELRPGNPLRPAERALPGSRDPGAACPALRRHRSRTRHRTGGRFPDGHERGVPRNSLPGLSGKNWASRNGRSGRTEMYPISASTRAERSWLKPGPVMVGRPHVQIRR